MTNNALLITNGMPLPLETTPTGSIWERRSAKGEALWSWISWGFVVYWLLFVAGAFLQRKELNVVGGVVILGVLGWILFERLWVKMDAVVIASLAAAVCLPFVQLMASIPSDPNSLFKHISLCAVMAAARLLQLPIVFKSKVRWQLGAQILIILLISLTLFKGSSWDGGTRHAGLFANPNNLALIPFLLLFFVNPAKDNWFIRLGAHAMVVAVLMFSGTSGSILAYVIGLTIHFRGLIPEKTRSLTYGLGAAIVLVGAIFLGMGGGDLLPKTRITNQLSVIGVQMQSVTDDSNIDYYQQERVLGPGSASGLWRVMHWKETLAIYGHGTVAEQIFGFGIGSTVRIMSILPHNEYLRLLFEQGIVGFLLFFFAWYRIIKTAPAEVQYVGIIIALYSFSENNLDNFPFMALLALCLSARGLGQVIKSHTTPSIVARPA